MTRVWLDFAPRTRFAIGVALMLVAGGLAIVGSFLPWTTPGPAKGIDYVHSGWELFDRYGLYAATHDTPRGYVYYDGVARWSEAHVGPKLLALACLLGAAATPIALWPRHQWRASTHRP